MSSNGIFFNTTRGQAYGVVLVDSETGDPVELSEQVQDVTPETGDTVVMTDTPADGTLLIQGGVTLAALTVTFPDDDTSRVGQIRRIASRVAITALTLNGTTIINGPTALTANQVVAFQKVTDTSWMRL